MAARTYRLPPPRPAPFSHTTIVAVAITVELLRHFLHPELYAIVPSPVLLSIAAIAGTFAVHEWSIPDTLPKVAVSVFFTQASMPTLVLIVWKLAAQVVASIVEALTRLTSVMHALAL